MNAPKTQFDPASLRLAALGRAATTRDAVQASRPRSQLDALMQTVATPASDSVMDEQEEGDQPPSDWWTTTIAVRLTRAQHQPHAERSGLRSDAAR